MKSASLRSELETRHGEWLRASHLQRLLPYLLVACWLGYVGAMVWQHAIHSVQPPLYDAISYLQKAVNFWREAQAGRLIEALTVQPWTRPFGTVLMSYPFGFSPDFHGFHFRSVFLPVVCTVAAVYIATNLPGRTQTSPWWTSSIAVLFSSLPMFYYFDWTEGTAGPVRWGLVDNFMAGVAAIAAAALLQSLARRSIRWLIASVFFAAVTLLIKPSGAVVMTLLALTWLWMLALDWLRPVSRESDGRERLRAYAVPGALTFAIVYGAAALFCVTSGYFSEGNLLYAKQALVVMKEVLRIPWRTAVFLFHQSFGEVLVLWGIIIALAFRRKVDLQENPQATFALRCAWGSMLAWVLGAWYWLVAQAGGSQIRYFYPFMLMGLIWLIPMAIEVWRELWSGPRAFFIALSIVPAVNLGALLAAGDSPPYTWQLISGVGVTVGADAEDVDQAHALLSELRRAGTDVDLYTFGNGIAPAVFVNVGTYEKSVRPHLASFRMITPQDWTRGFAVRKQELIESTYVLIPKYPESVISQLLAPRKFGTAETEASAFEAWFSRLNEDSGVSVVSEGKNLRLLRIVDRPALERAFDRFVAEHAWRPEFVAANMAIWWRADALPEFAGKAVLRDLDFDAIYKIEALSLTRSSTQIIVDVWWRELVHQDANGERFLFLHLVDSAGKILVNDQVPLFPYDPSDPERPLKHRRVPFNIEPVRDRLAALGFGIYASSGGYLVARSKSTDWGGRRILVPINDSDNAIARRP